MEHQAWILRSFLTQLESKDPDEETENSLAGEFLRLKRQSSQYRADKTYPTKAAEKQDNIKKNRYKDIVPFDHSRVKLTLTVSKHDSDYINASFIKGVSGSRAYIATQGPLPHTVLDFWRMLWEYNVEVIVMACREFEMGRKKCERYCPEKQAEPFVCEPFTIYCDSEENKGDYLTRTLRVTYHNRSRTLHQLHYVNWPDHGVPDSIPPILEMLQEMRSYQAHDEVPICIHCSAGCGRTGALCVIDYTWNLLKKEMIPGDFSIYGLVQTMRTERPSVVQTKEQYELVYRTIKFLFEKYLLSMDSQPSRHEMAAAPSSMTTDELNLSEELRYDVSPPELQHLLESEYPVIEKQQPDHVAGWSAPSLSMEGHVLMQSQGALSSPSAILCALRARDKQREQRLQYLPYAFPEALLQTQDLQEGPFVLAEERDDLPPPKPAMPPLAAVCLTVEDPYFESPLNSPLLEEASRGSAEDLAPTGQGMVNHVFNTPSLTLNDQSLDLNSSTSGTIVTHSVEGKPPPLPVRTAESYVLAVNAEHSKPCERLEVVIPPNAAALAVREMGGSPPSPVPQLPERTPESFELAIDKDLEITLMTLACRSAPAEQVTPAADLNRIGMSSEWSGNSQNAASQDEPKPWVRSKSLKVKMTFTAPTPITSPAVASNTTLNLPAPPPPPNTLTPPLSPRVGESLIPPLPERTPESFILANAEGHKNTAPCLQTCETTKSSPRIGISSEWAGTSQPKRFLDVVMNRSKSVRAKSSKQEPLTVQQPSVVVAGGGSEVEQHDLNHRPSVGAETSEDKSDNSNGKGMSRSKSLKFFRSKLKPKTAPPPAPLNSGPPPSHGSSFSVFKFGFGNRFGKPKGPRSHPESW
ncbi:tyrosine-protein phosphatase non-receptor type 22 isoform 2-T2 [Polymixia lowei]